MNLELSYENGNLQQIPKMKKIMEYYEKSKNRLQRMPNQAVYGRNGNFKIKMVLLDFKVHLKNALTLLSKL